jgi:hypothetical protein
MSRLANSAGAPPASHSENVVAPDAGGRSPPGSVMPDFSHPARPGPPGFHAVPAQHL